MTMNTMKQIPMRVKQSKNESAGLNAPQWRAIVIMICALIMATQALAQSTSDESKVPAETSDAAVDIEANADPGTSKTEPAPPTEDEQLLVQLRENLAMALQASGLAGERERQVVARRLNEVAEESGKLAKKLSNVEQQQEAYNNSIIADYELAQQAAQQRQQREANYRITRARGNARNLKQIDSPRAQALGDFWLMQSDLFEINQAGLESNAAQVQIIERMEHFLDQQDALPKDEEEAEEQARVTDIIREAAPGGETSTPLKDTPAAAETPREKESAEDGKTNKNGEQGQTDPVRLSMINDVQLALLRLYDQRGQSREACALVQQLRQDAEAQDNTAMIAELDRWYGYCPAVGTVLDAAVATTDGQRWTNKDQVGKVVILHFFADWYGPSIDAVMNLREAQERYGTDQVSLLSIDLSGGGLAGKAADAVNWPVCSDPAGARMLRGIFAVQSLPRYVVIDREGKIVSVGSSLVMIKQVEDLLPKKEVLPASKGK